MARILEVFLVATLMVSVGAAFDARDEVIPEILIVAAESLQFSDKFGSCPGDYSVIRSSDLCQQAAGALGIKWNSCCQSINNEAYGCLHRRPDGDVLWNGKSDSVTSITARNDRTQICVKKDTTDMETAAKAAENADKETARKETEEEGDKESAQKSADEAASKAESESKENDEKADKSEKDKKESESKEDAVKETDKKELDAKSEAESAEKAAAAEAAAKAEDAQKETDAKEASDKETATKAAEKEAAKNEQCSKVTVTLYPGRNYLGRSSTQKIGTYKKSLMGIESKSTSSMKVSLGGSITFWDWDEYYTLVLPSGEYPSMSMLKGFTSKKRSTGEGVMDMNWDDRISGFTLSCTL